MTTPAIWQTPYERFGSIPSPLVRYVLASTDRVMFDAIGSNAGSLVPFNPAIVAGYDTGSGGIAWTPSDWALFPNIPNVHIDQGGAGSPVYSANVMDVEPGAYSVSDIPNWIANATSPRPTVYADRNDAAAAIANGYTGPLWLAWPGWSGEPLPGNPGQVVAVQNVYSQNYDSSVVLDTAWPYFPAKETEMLSGILNPGEKDAIPFPSGSFTKIQLFHDFTDPKDPVNVRVAIHSTHHGYHVIQSYVITNSVPNTIPFPSTDIDGVSLVNESTTEIVSWTVS